jgi:hypothetical protein
MAKVLGPLNSSIAGGKVNNLVYARNKGGAYTRAYAVPTGTATSSQIDWRDALSSLSSYWESNIAGNTSEFTFWLDFSRAFPLQDRFGKPFTLDPRSWFIRLNSLRVFAGLIPLDLPPISPSCSYLPNPTFELGADGIYVDLDESPTGDELVLISKIPAQNLARNFAPNLQEFGVLLTSASSLPIKIWDEGDMPVANKRYFFWLRISDSMGGIAARRLYSLDTTPPLPTVIDTSVWDNMFEPSPDTNGDNGSTFDLRGIGSGGYNAVLLFDLSDIPSSPPTATECLLRLTCTFRNGLQIVDVYECLREIVTPETTWNIYSTGNSWAAGGAQGSGDKSVSVLDSKSIPSSGVYDFDITTLFNQWVSGSVPNRGLVVEHNYAPSISTWSSADSGNPSTVPQLLITWP